MSQSGNASRSVPNSFASSLQEHQEWLQGRRAVRAIALAIGTVRCCPRALRRVGSRAATGRAGLSTNREILSAAYPMLLCYVCGSKLESIGRRNQRSSVRKACPQKPQRHGQNVGAYAEPTQ
jgi:hypothetical protein